jgi:Flp pilus assembly pilin Flp
MLDRFQAFNRDEEGAAEPLHIVLAVAVGCVILAAITMIFPSVKTKFNQAVNSIISFNSNG